MAILEQGLIGTFTGKMGAIVVAKWKDRYVGKSKPRKSSKPASKTQVIQRAKFRLIGKFIAELADTISIGFKDTRSTTSMNEAMRHNLTHAISGVYPDYKVDYSKISLSDPNGRGKINHAIEPLLVPAAVNRLKFSWKLEEEPLPDTKPTDIIYLVFYHPVNHVYITKELVRSSLTSEIRLSRSFLGELHAWIFVASDDRRFATGTEYLGQVVLTA